MDNVGEIKASIRAHGYETDTDAQQLIFINKAVREILGDHRWRFMLSTATVPIVLAQATYTLPTSPALHRIESIRVANPSAAATSPEMQWVDSEELLAYAAANVNFSSWASPQLWTDPTTTTFQVFPAPSYPGDFTVRYLKQATQLGIDADVPDIPKAYRDLIVDAVCAKLAKRERQYDAATDFKVDYDAGLARMKGQYGLRQRQNSTRVASRDGALGTYWSA